MTGEHGKCEGNRDKIVKMSHPSIHRSQRRKTAIRKLLGLGREVGIPKGFQVWLKARSMFHNPKNCETLPQAAIQGDYLQACRGKSGKINAVVQLEMSKMHVRDF